MSERPNARFDHVERRLAVAVTVVGVLTHIVAVLTAVMTAPGPVVGGLLVSSGTLIKLGLGHVGSSRLPEPDRVAQGWRLGCR